MVEAATDTATTTPGKDVTISPTGVPNAIKPTGGEGLSGVADDPTTNPK